MLPHHEERRCVGHGHQGLNSSAHMPTAACGAQSGHGTAQMHCPAWAQIMELVFQRIAALSPSKGCGALSIHGTAQACCPEWARITGQLSQHIRIVHVPSGHGTAPQSPHAMWASPPGGGGGGLSSSKQHTHRRKVVAASQDMAQLQEVQVPWVAEDLTKRLLLWGQQLIRHSKQKVAAGSPLILQILPQGVMCRAACQIVLQGN